MVKPALTSTSMPANRAAARREERPPPEEGAAVVPRAAAAARVALRHLQVDVVGATGAPRGPARAAGQHPRDARPGEAVGDGADGGEGARGRGHGGH